MNYLKRNYVFSLLDFKMYRRNVNTNDSVINHHQKAHRDYEVSSPKIIIKLKKTTTNKN